MTSKVITGDDMGDNYTFQQLCNRETILINSYLNNEGGAKMALESILLFSYGHNAESKLIDLVEDMIKDGTIKERVNMFMVNFKEIIIVNGGDWYDVDDESLFVGN
jgi:hypothetical protein